MGKESQMGLAAVSEADPPGELSASCGLAGEKALLASNCLRNVCKTEGEMATVGEVVAKRGWRRLAKQFRQEVEEPGDLLRIDGSNCWQSR